MAPGLVSEVFLIDPPKRLPLVLHGLLWYFPNREATQGRSFLTLLIFLGIIYLLGNLRGFEGEMVQPVVPNQEIPLVLYQKFLG